jgi:lipopolysaccharide/colanic/teichoic acid biosynthesis glycosyltransferase
MHTSRTDLSRSPIEAEGPFGSGVARAQGGTAEAALITRTRLEQVPAAKPARMDIEPPRPLAGTGNGARMPQSAVERIRDIACALALILLLLPVLLILTILVAVRDPGPPIFAHTRVGKDGRRFKCYKLRSMYCDAEDRLADLLATNPVMRREWETSYKITNDPRVTPLGNFLRRSSLDELPQLFNVLLGSMTLVGPRPIVFDELKRYGRHAPCYLQVKPGLTGLWQVTGRCEVSYQRRVATDRLYARRKSLMLDFRILLATVPAVLARKGAW